MSSSYDIEDASRTGFHVAAHSGLHIMCLDLITNGFLPDALHRDGDTPLHLAAAYGHVEVVKRLLCQEGVNVNCVGRFSATPLSLALQNRQASVAKLLLSQENVAED